MFGFFGGKAPAPAPGPAPGGRPGGGQGMPGAGGQGASRPNGPTGGGQAIPFSAPTTQPRGPQQQQQPRSNPDDLFGGLGLKPAVAASTNGDSNSGLGGFNGGGGGGGDLFGNLSLGGGVTASSGSAPVVASGFSFVAGPPELTSTTTTTESSPFSFLGTTAPPTTAAMPAASGFAFANAGSTAASASSSSSSTMGHTAAVDTSIDTSSAAAGGGGGNVIKKKKPGFRPGFAREETGAAAATTTTMAGGGGNAGGSVLSGLTVHEAGDDDESSHASAHGGGSVLAGMRLHAASEDADTSGSSHNTLGGYDGEDRNGSRRGSVADHATTGSGAVLGGFQVHTPSTDNMTPVSSGFSFVGAGGNNKNAASSSSTPTPPVVAPTASSSEGGMFGGLFPKKSDTSSSSSSSSASSSKVSSSSSSGSSSTSTTKRSTSPTQHMRSTLSELNEAARKTRMRLADLKIRLRQLVDQERAIGVEMDKLRARVADIESKQDEAIRNELFEEAERLNESLDGVRGSLAAAEGRRRGIAETKARVEAEQEAAFAESLAAASTSVVGLREYNADRSGKLGDFRRDATYRHSSTVERVAADEEQLRLKEQHVRQDIKTVEDEEKQVEGIIREQTEELSRSVTELRERHARLTSEVADLERLLAAKRKEEQLAGSQLDESETRIRQIRGKFEKQAKRLQGKKADVEAEKQECSAEAEAIAKAKRDFSTSKRRDRRVERNFMRQLSHNNAELATAESLRACLLEQEGRRRGLASQARDAAAAAAAVVSDIEAAQRAVRATQTRKAQLEAQSSTLKKTIAGIDSKVPAVNEEKKLAVAGKKFKEAGRLNDELKRLSDQREEAARELSECTTGVDAAEEELGRIDASLVSLRSAGSAAEKVASEGRLELLKDAVRALSIQVRKLGARRPPVTVSPSIYEVDPVSLEKKEGSSKSADDESIDDSDEALGLEIDTGGQSAAQTAAVELLSAERDLLSDEMMALAAKLGVSADIGPLPPLETQVGSRSSSNDDKQDTTPEKTTEDSSALTEVENMKDTLSSPTYGNTDSQVDQAESSPITVTGFSSSSSSAVTGAINSESLLASFGSAATSAEVVVPAAGGFSMLGFIGDTTAATATESTTEVVAADASIFAALSASNSGAVEETNNNNNNDTTTSDASDGSSTQQQQQVDEPQATVDHEALRLAELASTGLALYNLLAAIQEKNAVIEDAVSREDFDTCDAAQADIDSMNDHKESLLSRARELGVGSEEELLSYKDADTLSTNNALVAPAAESSSPSSSLSLFAALSSSTTTTEAVSSSSSSSFLDALSASSASSSSSSAEAILSSSFSAAAEGAGTIAVGGFDLLSALSASAVNNSGAGAGEEQGGESAPLGTSALPFMVGGFDSLATTSVPEPESFGLE